MSTSGQREKSKPLLCLLFVHRSETKRLTLLKYTPQKLNWPAVTMETKICLLTSESEPISCGRFSLEGRDGGKRPRTGGKLYHPWMGTFGPSSQREEKHAAFKRQFCFRTRAEGSPSTERRLFHRRASPAVMGPGFNRHYRISNGPWNVSREHFLENGRYCVKLPLEKNRDLLPDNYDLSLARLNSVMWRLRKEPSIIKEYDQTFRDQLHDGIIERVEETEEQLLSQTQYLPHQAFIRSDALTTKLRVVFDASAEVKPNCPSLNDWLLRVCRWPRVLQTSWCISELAK